MLEITMNFNNDIQQSAFIYKIVAFITQCNTVV